MSCQQTDLIECDTVQLIEPKDDLLVDSAGTTNDMDERGTLELSNGQQNAIVYFEVKKLTPDYSFEYLYVDAMGNPQPGAVEIIPTIQAVEGFAVVFAGTPIGSGYVLHWRVTVHRLRSQILIDAPEDLYLQMPQANTMAITFHQQRSNISYGFTELRVENLTELPGNQSPIHIQVYRKTISGFFLAVNPTPPTTFYYLKVRTP